MTSDEKRNKEMENTHPQFSVIIFPYLFLTKELDALLPEEFRGDSLLKLAQEKNVGVIGLKPFGAGTTFNLKPQEIKGRVDKRATSLVKKMLQEKRQQKLLQEPLGNSLTMLLNVLQKSLMCLQHVTIKPDLTNFHLSLSAVVTF